VFEKMQIKSVQEIIGYVYSPARSKGDIAALASLLSIGLEARDRSSLKIAAKSAASLVELVVPIMERFGVKESAPVAMAGSVLLKNDIIQGEVIRQLKQRYPSITCYPAKKDAAFGSILLALEQLAQLEQ